MPDSVVGGNLYQAGDKLYIIGGRINTGTGTTSNRIYQASLADPLTWTLLGDTLPAVRGYVPLQVVDETLYLFGGYTNGVVNTVFSAPLATPTTWTQVGTTPTNNYGAASVRVGDYIYLYGGYNTGALSTIYRAPVSAPTTWSNTSFALPAAAYHIDTTVIGDNIYFFYNNSVWQASTRAPERVQNLGYLPVSVGNGTTAPKFILGDKLYLFPSGTNQIMTIDLVGCGGGADTPITPTYPWQKKSGTCTGSGSGEGGSSDASLWQSDTTQQIISFANALGKVGIGTSNPQYTLDVRGLIAAEGLVIGGEQINFAGLAGNDATLAATLAQLESTLNTLTPAAPLPQDLYATSSPTFADLNLTSNLSAASISATTASFSQLLDAYGHAGAPGQVLATDDTGRLIWVTADNLTLALASNPEAATTLEDLPFGAVIQIQPTDETMLNCTQGTANCQTTTSEVLSFKFVKMMAMTAGDTPATGPEPNATYWAFLDNYCWWGKARCHYGGTADSDIYPNYQTFNGVNGTATVTNGNNLSKPKDPNILQTLDNFYDSLPAVIGGIAKTTAIPTHKWEMIPISIAAGANTPDALWATTDGVWTPGVYNPDGDTANQYVFSGNNVMPIMSARIGLLSYTDWQGGLTGQGYGSYANTGASALAVNGTGRSYCEVRFGRNCTGGIGTATSSTYSLFRDEVATNYPNVASATDPRPRYPWLRSITSAAATGNNVWYVSADNGYSVRNGVANTNNGVSPALWLSSKLCIADTAPDGTYGDPYELINCYLTAPTSASPTSQPAQAPISPAAATILTTAAAFDPSQVGLGLSTTATEASLSASERLGDLEELVHDLNRNLMFLAEYDVSELQTNVDLLNFLTTSATTSATLAPSQTLNLANVVTLDSGVLAFATPVRFDALLTAAAGLAVEGNATISSHLTTTTLAVTSDTTISGHLSLTTFSVSPDLAGLLTIPAGTSSATHHFQTPFSHPPIINLTPILHDYRYYLESTTNSDFSIHVTKPPEATSSFNWSAVGVGY
jgi:hypothetical protein